MKEQLTVADYEEVLADHRRLVRELDVLLNGEHGAAKQASLCDIVGQLKRQKCVPSSKQNTKHERRVVGHVSGWKEQMSTCVCGKPWPCAEAAECSYCHGNDRNAPCAYPSEGKPGCLRDKRLAVETNGWQPIETAPKVYRPPLSQYNHHAPEILGLYGKSWYCVCSWGGPSAPYWIDGNNKKIAFQPTHWMPLPAAPGSPLEPTCSTCGRTKDDPDAMICSNSFHLPEKASAARETCGKCGFDIRDHEPGELQRCLSENGSVPQQPPVDNDHVAPGCEKFDE